MRTLVGKLYVAVLPENSSSSKCRSLGTCTQHLSAPKSSHSQPQQPQCLNGMVGGRGHVMSRHTERRSGDKLEPWSSKDLYAY